MEFVARNARVGPLAVLADGADELAHAVVLGNGLADGLVRDVDAVVLVQRREDVVAALEHIQIQTVVVGLHRDLHVLVEELRLALAHGLEQLHVLDGAVHHRAAVRRDHAVGKIVAALNGALEQCAAVFAQEAGHIIRGHFHGAGARRAQARRESTGQVQQRLGRVFAGIGDADFPLVLRLCNQVVVRFLQKVFEVQKMFQVFHGSLPLRLFFYQKRLRDRLCLFCCP